MSIGLFGAMRSLAAALLLIAASLLVTPVALAQSDDEFDAAMERAYSSFRSAYWYTRTGNFGVATMEMMSFAHAWEVLRRKYEAAPPEAYVGDERWAETLADVAAINDEALEQVGAGSGSDGQQTLTRLRQALADLRARNGVVTFSDFVNGYDAVIQRLSAYRDWDKVLSDDDWRQMATLGDDAGDAIDALAGNAPERLAGDPDFLRTVQENRDALGRFREHLANRDDRGAKGSIRDLRSAYGLLFLKYG